MGEPQVPLFAPTFNHAVRVVTSTLPLSEDTGSLLVREASRQLGLDERLGRLPDVRDPDHIQYSLAELVRTRVLLLAQGWADQSDATTLRGDAALRMAVSDRAGDGPAIHEGLASQPTLSRMQHALARPEGTQALETTLRGVAFDRLQRDERVGKRLTIDIDTLPIEVHGHQQEASYNTHYGYVCFQPFIALSETGDLLAVQLRGGGSPSAEEAWRFLEPVLDEAARRGFRVCVRMDCGFANAFLMRQLDARKVRFITRLKTTGGLCTRTDDWFTRTLAWWREHPEESRRPRVATYELWESPRKADRVRRIVAVAVEPEPGTLVPRRFFLCTNLARREAGSMAVLQHYRQRGTAETFIGDFVRETVPSLRAVPRSAESRVGFADNHVALLLAALAYELLHHLRRGLERVTDEGWSLRRLRERVLKIATQVVRHARRVFFRICPTKAPLWHRLARALLPAPVQALEVAP